MSLLNNLNLNNYSFEFTPTETCAGGTLLYIANHLSYKCCNDLNIYKKNELESTFIEIVSPKKSIIFVGVIYRHPSMDLTNFNCNFLNKLIENISKKQKSIFLLGDFNVNLLNYNEHNQTNEFLDSLACNSFISLIFPQDFEILGWCPAEPVLPHGEKVLLYPWLATLLVMVSK